MIDIRDYIAPELTAGREFGIEAKVMLWLNAGSGEVVALEPRLLSLKARLQVFGSERPLDLQVALGDPVPMEDGSLAGPCTLRSGDEADGDAVWKVDGNRLLLAGTVDGDKTQIALSRQGGRTLVEMAGRRSVTLRLTAG